MAFGPNQLQIAIFPIVCFWRNEEGEVKKGTIIYNSDDLHHDNQQIRKFLKRGVEITEDKTGKKFNKLVHFSDGCGAQVGICKLNHCAVLNVKSIF